LRWATLFIAALALGANGMGQTQESGIIGEAKEDGLPVIYKLVDESPSAEVRNRYRWLTVVSWKYDRSVRNGMPPEDTNKQMIALEHAIEDLERGALCRHAYSRTGNGLKEFVYYISDRDRFMDAFNNALSEHPPYPIEISFYEDPPWEEFERIRGLFRKH
jgi:hypothetical protein